MTDYVEINGETITIQRISDNSDVEISPYDENEKRVINGKVVNVTYHAIDWAKCFRNA